MQKPYLVILSLIIFKYVIIFERNAKLRWINYCRESYEFCPICFDRCCEDLLENAQLDAADLETTINSMFGSRNLERAIWNTQEKSPQKVVLKYLSNDDNFHRIKGALCNYLTKNSTDLIDCDALWQQFMKNKRENDSLLPYLKRIYETSKWTDGLVLCPSTSIDNFISTFNRLTDNATLLFWIQLFVNPELVVLKAIKNMSTNHQNNLHQFIPSVIDWCGFVIVEEYSGISLYEFYKHSFRDRLYIAQQILEAAVAFSYGINNFRLVNSS